MTWRPGKNFRVGAMRHQITVQNFTSSRDGAGQAVATWADLLTSEPARFIQTGGGTSYRGRQLEESVVAVFEVRYRTGYDTTQRIQFDGQTYGIMRVEPVDGGRRYIALYCKGVAA
jgi:SPP1 family predicted phage head-tail adaptor